MTAPIATLRGVTKRYGALLANDQVDFSLWPGEVHALVGENGAGKSTLMKILCGLVRPDAGSVQIGGVQPRPGVRGALELGVGMVHQHFMLVDTLTVAENLVLGQEPLRHGLLDRGAARVALRALATSSGLAADPDALVGDLTVGERQRVEILKVLHRGVRVLVLDEPTAVLVPAEAAALCAMLRRWADAGRAVVLVSHRLDEVLGCADRVTVLRQGRHVTTLPAGDTDAAALARLMVGREVRPPRAEARVVPPEAPVLLAARGLSADRAGRRVLQEVSFELHAGEILGVAGVLGNGQTELLEVLAGTRAPCAGHLELRGRDVTALSVAARIRAGLGRVPEDRFAEGLVRELSVAENLLLGRQAAWGGWRGLDLGRIGRNAALQIQRCDLRPPDPAAPAGALSGGNAQKLVLARELAPEPWGEPCCLLAGQPTRGVDVGAVEAIHLRLRAARDRGAGILLVSADLTELLALSDRIAVMFRGRIVAVFPAAEASAARLGECMAGLVGARAAHPTGGDA